MAETGVRIWTTRGNSLFNVSEDVPVYMAGVRLSSIHWGSGNPRVETVKAKVVLSSYLPADSLFNFGNGGTLHILRREHGRLDEYDSKLLVALFNSCAIMERWIDEIVPAFYDHEQEIAMYVQMEVSFRMFNDDH